MKTDAPTDSPEAAPRLKGPSKRFTLTRGDGPALAAAAQSRGMKVPAVIRMIVADWLATHAGTDAIGVSTDIGADDRVKPPNKDGFVRLRLLLPIALAERVAREARVAEVSRAFYVERLMNGLPVPPDQRENRNAILRSNDALAVLGTDMREFMRVMRQTSPTELAACEVVVARLSEMVFQHVTTAATVLSTLSRVRLPSAGKPVKGSKKWRR